MKVEHRSNNLNGGRSTVEGGIAGSIDGFYIFDIFGGSLVAGGFELFFPLGPNGALVDG